MTPSTIYQTSLSFGLVASLFLSHSLCGLDCTILSLVSIEMTTLLKKPYLHSVTLSSHINGPVRNLEWNVNNLLKLLLLWCGDTKESVNITCI